jgi:hypothetical protein
MKQEEKELTFRETVAKDYEKSEKALQEMFKTEWFEDKLVEDVAQYLEDNGIIRSYVNAHRVADWIHDTEQCLLDESHGKITFKDLALYMSNHLADKALGNIENAIDWKPIDTDHAWSLFDGIEPTYMNLCRKFDLFDRWGFDIEGEVKTLETSVAKNYLKSYELSKKHPDTYTVWLDMNNRCYDPQHPEFPNEGAKGAEVCKEWKIDNPEGFINYVDNMEVAPS